MILKDLIIIDRPHFTEISSFVIIKRDDKYYEIVVRMRDDYNPRLNHEERLTNYKELINRFMRECETANAHYKISDGNIVNVQGMKIHEEEFKF
jgi:hypothetical protein